MPIFSTFCTMLPLLLSSRILSETVNTTHMCLAHVQLQTKARLMDHDIVKKGLQKKSF